MSPNPTPTPQLGPSWLTVLGILAPVIATAAGALAVQTRDLYNRRSEMGRRNDAMEDATRQVTFAAEWWKAKQALGSASDDRAARAIVESWLEEATSRVSEALHPPRRAKPKPDLPKHDLSVTRRMLLAYPFQSRWGPARQAGLLFVSGLHRLGPIRRASYAAAGLP
jgi:hypothetical protein